MTADVSAARQWLDRVNARQERVVDGLMYVNEADWGALTAAVRSVLDLADELELCAIKSAHPMGGYNEGYNEGLSDGEHYAAERVRAAVAAAEAVDR